MYRIINWTLSLICLLNFAIADKAPAHNQSNAIEVASKAVVNITAMGQREMNAEPNDPHNNHFESLGSGVIIDAKDGLIITNAHVVNHATMIFVTLYDGTRLYAHVVGQDPDTDLALVAVKHPDLQAIHVADPLKQLHVGESVIAVGNPFGLDHTITSGIISGLNRSIPPSENMIQTDAPINPGNSGGALLNDQGELIGICSSITTYTGGNIGIGFATPLTITLPIIDQLKEFGVVERGIIGLMIQNLTPPLTRALKVSEVEGVLVSDVMPDSPASAYGVEPEDIIIKFNDVPVYTSNQLRSLVGTVRRGQKLSLTIIRKNEQIVKSIDLKTPEKSTRSTSNGIDGAELIEYEQLDNSGIIRGLYVINVNEGSPALLTGLLPQDLILEINHKPVKSLSDLTSLMKNKTNDESLIKVRRHNHTIYLALR